ncbi:ThiF family adenylyltransferase [Micromonospora coxensis]|uniref:Molybdopterin or thiamine biosynthesis adenylyltransferase n=1 Tax=Micromonospora coxensis TaxID=356852 RepID=A0A1C5H1W3_9ACTN|nr:ThiF family adenylyltransferase [Micromonospora coxensis]SCG40059.1 Molybdopterin or thiamine biosynthesis adenylyltransferase [Micromonospora coxensis]
MRPRLKSLNTLTTDGTVVIYRRPTERIHLDDPGGGVRALVELLAQGAHEEADLPAELTRLGHPTTAEDVRDAIAALDDLRLLENADADPDAETLRRHESNLRFYDLYADLGRSSGDLHHRLAHSTVLVIGAGGLGGGVLQSLLGLGVARVRIVDFDTVEPKNLARQFVYGAGEIGRSKVAAAAAWARRYAPQTVVEAVEQEVTDAATIRALGADVDLVVLAADQPVGIQLMTNEACFDLGVPFIAGGFKLSTLFYWSVEPGHTPCRLCLELHRDDDLRGRDEWVRSGLRLEADPVNRTTGPVAQLLSGLIALEAQRYLARTEEPVAGGTYQTIEIGDRMRVDATGWERHPDCALCHRSADGGR